MDFCEVSSYPVTLLTALSDLDQGDKIVRIFAYLAILFFG
jgi:hypothetical protein